MNKTTESPAVSGVGSTDGLECGHEQRLRAFVMEHLHGQCKIISQGGNCTCLLCDLDRLCDEVRSNNRIT